MGGRTLTDAGIQRRGDRASVTVNALITGNTMDGSGVADG